MLYTSCHLLCLDLHPYMLLCLDLHALCFMPCFLCLDLFFPCVAWLDPHVSMLVYMSIFLSYMFYALCYIFLCFVPFLLYGNVRFTCMFPRFYVIYVLCHLSCARALHAMFVCLGLDLVCHDMCYCSPFVALSFFHVFLAYWFGLDLYLMVFVIVHTPRPTSKGLDHPDLHVYACLLLCFMLVLASLVLGFAMFGTLSGCMFVWLHLMPMRSCLGCNHVRGIFGCQVAPIIPFPFFSPCNGMLIVLACGFLCIFTRLHICPCMSFAC